MTYSNPRKQALFDDWPFGRTLKCKCVFKVETDPKRGERVSRTTVDPRNGRLSKPKTTTYARKVRIVDGDDGRTYILETSQSFGGLLIVMESNLAIQHEVIYSDNPRFAEVAALLRE